MTDVATFVIDTEAPGRTPPDVSVTRPDMVPPATWADDSPAKPPVTSRPMVRTPTTNIRTGNAIRRVIGFSILEPDELWLIPPDGPPPCGCSPVEAES